MSRLPLLLLCCAVSALAAPKPPTGQLLREPGAIYLEDFAKHSVKIGVTADAPIFFQPDKVRSLGVLRAGQLVELQAVSDTLYRVRGQAQQGQVAGWVDPKFLGPLKPEFLAALKQNAVRRDAIVALIAKNEVAINMTPEEVFSSLGKPTKKTSKLDAGGRQEVWEYTRYERIPQQTTSRDNFGRLVTSVYYIKVAKGNLSIVFDNNLVSSLEQSEGAPAAGDRVKILTAPLEFAF
ncbi:MAG TPA: hypothetical protein VGO11_00920 [Chthoniobacteraceae bacterium]|nr:hypothetical protein [Chthoniobacteraceae bacterium]